MMDQPARWSDSIFADHDGSVWLRRSLRVPATWDGRPQVLGLGAVDDMDMAWLDGEVVGATTTGGQWQQRRRYELPKSATAAGEKLLVVRVVDTGGEGGLTGAVDDLALALGDGSERIPLAGRWHVRRGRSLDGLEPFPARPWLGPNAPSALFNGMLAPLLPYSLAGVAFYQGENNRLEGALYRRLLPALIADWRRGFGMPELPFHYVQIAPFAYGGDTGQAAELREAQRLTLAVPATGMVVTMDIGDPGDIHPKNKQEVGRRLMLWALAANHGRDDVVPSGPLFARSRRVGARLRVSFEHADGGLRTRDGAPPSHLEVAAADGRWYAATGRLDGAELVVWSDEVPLPVAVRYGWGAADEPNLCGATGLPASSFSSADG